MAYIGRGLDKGNYLKLDSIKSQFDGINKTFNLSTGGVPFYPGSAYAILVSVAGVILEPNSQYTIDKSQITFLNPPSSSDSFFCISLGTSLSIGIPGDGTVTGEKLAGQFNYDSGLLYLDSLTDKVGIGTTGPTSKLTVQGDARVSGVLTATTFVGALTGTATSTTNIPNLSGDITSSNTVTTLATVNSNTGTYGGTGSIPVITVNGKGLVTGVTTVAPNNGTLTLAVSGTGLSGSATFTANQSGNSTFTVTSNATSNNDVSTIVSRDSSGGFSAGIVTATQFSTGASGTGINIGVGTISGPSLMVIDPAAVGDNTGAVRILGDLYVDGTQTYINSTTIELADFNVGIATTVGTNALLDGAGIGIGSTGIRKTITWNNSASALTSSEDWNLVSGKSYEINGTSVLNATTLGSGVVNSSLTSVGTLGQLTVTGASTFTNGPVLIGSATSTGTASQPLQVAGGAYINGSVGIGTSLGFTSYSNSVTIKAAASDIAALYLWSNRASGSNTNHGSIYFYNQPGDQIAAIVGTGSTTAPAIRMNLVGSDIARFTPAGILVGSANSTGTSSQLLQVNSGGYFNGSVGIGITNPQTALHLGSGGNIRLNRSDNTRSSLIFHDNNGFNINANTTGDDVIINAGNISGRVLLQANSSTTLTAQSGTVLIGTATSTGTATQALQVNSGAYVSGSVGIGTTSPGSALDVAGELRIYPFSGAGILRFGSGGVEKGKVSVDASSNYIVETAGSERMRLDSSGRLGIGTANPSDPLHLQGIFRIDRQLSAQDQTYIRYFRQGTEKARFGLLASDNAIYFNATNSDTANHLIINSSGNLGVGVVPSAWQSSVKAIQLGSRASVFSYNNTTSDVGNNCFLNTSTDYIYLQSAASSLYRQSSGAHTWYNAPSGTAGAGITFTQAMTLDASGNLGINTTSPLQKLDVRGNFLLAADGTTANHITQKPYTINNGTLSWEGSAGQLFSITNTLTSGSIYSVNYVSGIPAIDVNADGTVKIVPNVGKVAIGKTSVTAGMVLDVNGATNLGGALTVSGQIISTQANSTATGGGQIYLNGSTGNRIDFNQNGVAAPTFTTRSAGTKIVLYPGLTAASADYAFGIEGSTLWSSVPDSTTQFKWYAGTTNIATLSGAGAFTASSTVTGSLLRVTTSTPGNFGSITASYGGNSSYPTLYSDSADRWIMHINPHISYTANGVNGFTGSMTGATIRMASNTSGTTYWDMGIGTNSVGTDKFSIGRAGNSLFCIDNAGNIGVGVANPSYKLEVNGSFGATTKSFIIDHPTKPGKRLQYGSLEGPENGVYIRGRSKESIIELPEYWINLVHADSITVNLTPIGDSATPRVRKIENNQVEVFSKEEGELDYYYMILAERKDVDKLEVELEA